MLELYHAEPVVNSMKCLHCLKEKSLDFVSHYVNLLLFEQHSPEFVKLNPNGQVPVLIHDGAVITESTVINEYLDDVFPQVPLRPASFVERARMVKRLPTTSVFRTPNRFTLIATSGPGRPDIAR